MVIYWRILSKKMQNDIRLLRSHKWGQFKPKNLLQNKCFAHHWESWILRGHCDNRRWWWPQCDVNALYTTAESFSINYYVTLRSICVIILFVFINNNHNNNKRTIIILFKMVRFYHLTLHRSTFCMRLKALCVVCYWGFFSCLFLLLSLLPMTKILFSYMARRTYDRSLFLAIIYSKKALSTSVLRCEYLFGTKS